MIYAICELGITKLKIQSWRIQKQNSNNVQQTISYVVGVVLKFSNTNVMLTSQSDNKNCTDGALHLNFFDTKNSLSCTIFSLLLKLYYTFENIFLSFVVV